METDRSALITKITYAEDYVEELCSRMIDLKKHSYISKKQSEFIQHKKFSVREGEVVAELDFSENLSYAVQDAIQTFHWNNDHKYNGIITSGQPFLAFSITSKGQK